MSASRALSFAPVVCLALLAGCATEAGETHGIHPRRYPLSDEAVEELRWATESGLTLKKQVISACKPYRSEADPHAPEACAAVVIPPGATAPTPRSGWYLDELRRFQTARIRGGDAGLPDFCIEDPEIQIKVGFECADIPATLAAREFVALADCVPRPGAAPLTCSEMPALRPEPIERATEGSPSPATPP